MKLPEKIKGFNRIRDGWIVLRFKRDNWDYSEIAERVGLGERRVMQILAKNHAFIKRDPAWEKEKRINRLHRWIKKDGKLKDSNKDPVDIQDMIRKEIEGDGPQNSNNVTINSITYNWQQDNNDPVRPARLSVGDTQQPR